MSVQYVCQDFLLFQDQLKKMRDLDDKIIYALNVSIPTESFKHKSNTSNSCGELLTKIDRNFDQRHTAIKECIAITADRVKVLRTERETKQNDNSIDKNFKSEQRKLRLLQSELNVEDIIRDRTMQIFHDRCGRL